jgi:hypothetical protein
MEAVAIEIEAMERHAWQEYLGLTTANNTASLGVAETEPTRRRGDEGVSNPGAPTPGCRAQRRFLFSRHVTSCPACSTGTGPLCADALRLLQAAND